MVIVDKDENVVYSWTTTGEDYRIEDIPLGDYVLKEVYTPDGYIPSEDIPFTIIDTPEEQPVHMEDDITKLKVYKQDEEGRLIGGAVLQILDEEGKVVDEWETVVGEPHELIKVLRYQGKYVLHEASVPAMTRSFETTIDFPLTLEKPTPLSVSFPSPVDIFSEMVLPPLNVTFSFAHTSLAYTSSPRLTVAAVLNVA